jgi:hypothetical protein
MMSLGKEGGDAMNNLAPIQPTYGVSPSSFLGASGTGASTFEDLLLSTEANTTSDATNARLQYLNTQYQVQQSLYGMLSPTTEGNASNSLLAMTLQDMTASGGSLSVPSWVSDAQRVMGAAFPSQVVNLYTQAQNLLTGNSTFSSLT